MSPARLAAGLALLLVAASVALTILTGDLSASSDGGTIALALTFSGAGYLVARRQPGNPVGWLLMGTGLAAAFTTGVSLYLLLDYGSRQGSLPAGPLLFVAGNALWPVSMLTGMAAVLMFPDGRLPRPWRRALAAYCAAGAGVLVTQAVPALLVVANAAELHAAATGQAVAAPPGGAITRFLATGLPVLALVPFWLAWVGRQVAAYRRARGDVRQQFKWFTAGAAVTLLGVVLLTTAESGTSPSRLAVTVNVAATYAAGLAFPLGMAVAILRYRLYDIDRIISRTLAYTIVTGLLAGIYAGVVLLATQVLPFTTPVAVAAATLAAAALFNPLRRRVQRLADRRFNRARYDADAAVAAFAARLQDASDPDRVRARLADAVQASLEPAHVSVWVTGDAR